MSSISEDLQSEETSSTSKPTDSQDEVDEMAGSQGDWADKSLDNIDDSLQQQTKQSVPEVGLSTAYFQVLIKSEKYTTNGRMLS